MSLASWHLTTSDAHLPRPHCARHGRCHSSHHWGTNHPHTPGHKLVLATITAYAIVNLKWQYIAIIATLSSHHVLCTSHKSSVLYTACSALGRLRWFIFTAQRYASAVLAVIVCLSVCLSVTSRSCTKMAKSRIRLTMPYNSPETLVSRCQKS